VGFQGRESEPVAVGGPVEVVAGERAGERQRLPDLLAPAGLRRPGGQVGVGRGIEERRIHVTTLARLLPLIEGGEDGGDGAPRPHDVCHRDSRHGVRGGQGPCHGLIGEVVPGAAGVGPVLSPAGDRAVDEVRVAGAELVRREP
jgi:hypothetical protein